jgi:hypothetical protein
MRSLCLAALFCFFICSVAAAQDQPQTQPTYSKEELDSRLKDLETKDDVAGRFAEVYKRAEVDSKLTDLRNALSQGASKAEVDARIGDLQKVFDATEKRNSDWRSDIDRRVSVLENKSPPVSPWLALGISAAAALLSGFGIYWSARTAKGVAETSREETRRVAREVRADSLVTAWQALSGRIGQALGLFRSPDLILNPNGTTNTENHALLVELGNWYDRMAELWRNKTADPDIVRAAGLKAQAEEFWKGLETVRVKLPDLQTQMNAWNNLNWLATTPDV